MIVLPAMPPEQTASWLGLLDLHERLAEGWTLIMVSLFTCIAPSVGSFL